MRTVWKWQLRAAKDLILTLHQPKILHVGQDPQGGDEPCVWIEHDADTPSDTYMVITFIGTGHPVPDDIVDHVGSCQCGPFVWHVYARTTS